MTHEEKIELEIRRILGICEANKIDELVNLVLRYEDNKLREYLVWKSEFLKGESNESK